MKKNEPAEAVVVWVIYEHPSDYPNSYVVRPHYVYCGRTKISKSCVIAATLEEARKVIPEWCVMLASAPGDDPVIKETWI